MRVAVEKVDGVKDAAVSLNDGEVVIVLDEANGVELDHVRETIRDQGFTPREADVRVRGAAERRGGIWFFRVSGSEVPYEILAESDVMEELEGRSGQPVVVRGRVEEESPRRLRIVSVDGPDRGEP